MKIVGKIVTIILAIYGVFYSIMIDGVIFFMISRHGYSNKYKTGISTEEFCAKSLKEIISATVSWWGTIFDMSLSGWKWFFQ